MTLHLPTLIFACLAMLTLSASALAVFGLGTRIYRGYWWWVAAQFGSACGLALWPQSEAYPMLSPLVCLLSLQWPVTVLAGLRRFYGRHEWVLPAWVDLLLLTAAFGVWAAVWVADAGLPVRVAVFSAGSALLGLYALWLVVRLSEFKQNAALGALAVSAGLNAAYQLWRIGASQSQPAAPFDNTLLIAGALLSMLTAFVLLGMALRLTSERTEANLLATQRQLRVLADVDVLTGMANRRHFLECADTLLTSPDAMGGTGSTVLMFDIDHFKQVNDLLGHAVGDEALRQIGRCVHDTLRERDLAGRLGGDEFAVLLPGTSLNDAVAVAARIVALLEHRQVAPRVARLSLSFGIVLAHPGEPIVDALRRADQALYEAKRQGRSRAVTASGDADQPVFGESRPMGLTA